ncbi:MAG: polysaccharide deacetylase family protein [Tychonema bourrellyi B0820]|uniref:Polysaccharide deacetylase n=1 Tax=Tychonema bourrellyi FEM_GT703 TaxID=2040638 RepID=A0A2G4F6M9_9CYAN|nr:polysaccharide deacetylase family protein [Tychonema bourrellyi]MDQ2097224.1 polysaccharide deacetylase family protein [Tychonema bourrellyi B0820]PHX57410.1 polysaccharide deacetylase [Tychonema bourrellyi FEM_GT703]
MNKYILLSFDIEEFDIPEEYGQPLENDIKFAVSQKGLLNVISLLDRLEITATFFVTANFALHNREIIKQLSQQHEIASHGFYHSQFSPDDLLKSKETLESITNTKVTGFRMARLQPIDDAEIEKAGYEYNSSMNPTYIPGRYNNLSKPRTAYYTNKLLNLPISVTPLIRFPLFWLSFKNFPLSMIQLATKLTLETDSYLNIYFHPWEFTDISQFKLPAYVKKNSGSKMIDKLEKYLTVLKNQGRFISISEFKKNFSSKII